MLTYIHKTADITLSLDLISLCNLKCSYCYASSYRERIPVWLKEKDILNLIHQNSIRTFKVVLLGGEPALYPNLSSLIEKLTNTINVKEILLVTNGTKLNVKALPFSKKISVCLSVHFEENNFEECFKRAVLLKQRDIKCFLRFIKVPKHDAKIEWLSLLDSYGIPYMPGFLFNKDQTFFTDTILSQPKDYVDTETGEKYTFKEIYDTLTFKGHMCLLSNYRIFADGKIIIECIEKEVGNIRDGYIFNIISYTCQFNRCNDDCLAEIDKLSYDKIK